MQPEPIAAGLVTTLHRGVGRQSDVGLRAPDLRLQRRERTGGHRAHERRLIDPRGHRELPLGVAELEGERNVEGTRVARGRVVAGGMGFSVRESLEGARTVAARSLAPLVPT